MGIGEVTNGLIKLTVCAYRPWIRSDLIEPAGDSKTAATGYSFPSGHTVKATEIYGTSFVWQKDKRRWISVLCAVLIVLTGFSRNFLGVHTPQDVICGFLEASILICVVGFAQKKINGNEKTLDILTVVGLIFVVFALIYITQKSYPLDYVDGELLVDPQKMMPDSFKACGELTGLLVGSYFERHYIHYKIRFESKSLALLTCIGAFLMLAWKQLFAPAIIVAAFGNLWGNFFARFIMYVFALTIWPIVITKVSEKE